MAPPFSGAGYPGSYQMPMSLAPELDGPQHEAEALHGAKKPRLDLQPSYDGSMQQLSAAARVAHHSPIGTVSEVDPSPSSPASPGDVDWAGIDVLRMPKDMSRWVAEYVSNIDGAANALDHTIRILHSRVVQKSYGSEKRFFCPPPNVSLTEPEDECSRSEPVIGVGISDVAEGRFDSQIDVERTADGCIARARFLYISDADKRKHFKVRVRVLASGGRDLGVFQSAPVKVISKPSKRKFSMSNLDMRIDSGEVIALFNRVRSQPGSTRFLGSSASAFSLSTTRWGTFEIIRRSPPIKSVVHHNASSDFVHYNMTVVLKSRESGLLSAEYVIRKAERNTVNTSDADPVSQLQKVAFLIKGSDRMYLASQDGDVTVRQSKLSPNGAEVLFDNCIWTIGSAEIQAHSLCVRYQQPALAQHFGHLMSQPTVAFIRHRGDAVEICGADFHEHLAVWFESTPTVTSFRGTDRLLCRPPVADRFCSADGTPRSLPFSVYVLLVRTDGVIYRTNYTYTYAKAGSSPPIVAADEASPATAAAAVAASFEAETTPHTAEPSLSPNDTGGEPRTSA